MLALVGIQVQGVPETVEALDEFSAATKDKSDPLGKIGSILHAHLTAAYDSQGAAGGSGPWVPLTAEYGAWKAEKGPGVPILVGLKPDAEGTRRRPNMDDTWSRSGKMRDAILAPLQNKATWQVTPSRMRYRPVSRIAFFHQRGTRKMMSRPPVDPPPQFGGEIDDTFVDWLNGLIERHI